MGQNVLSCRFLTGLRQNIKEKLLVSEGDLDLLLTKASFEEAKNDTKIGKTLTTPSINRGSSNNKKINNNSFRPEYYACGLRGHLARDCQSKVEQHHMKQKVETVLLDKWVHLVHTKKRRRVM
jgi:hypothetical protein